MKTNFEKVCWSCLLHVTFGLVEVIWVRTFISCFERTTDRKNGLYDIT